MSDIGNYSITNSDTQNQLNTKSDAFELVAKFDQEIIKGKPSIAIMKKDIQMNALKMRPYMGDVFHLNMTDSQFIDALWSILKLEEYMISVEKKLKKGESKIFYQMMKQYRDKLQAKINQIDMRLPHIKSQGIQNPVTIEIFRDLNTTKNKRRVH